MNASFQRITQAWDQIHMNDNLNHLFEESKHVIASETEEGVWIFDPLKPTCLATNWAKTGVGFRLFQKHCNCPGDKPFCCRMENHFSRKSIHTPSRVQICTNWGGGPCSGLWHQQCLLLCLQLRKPDCCFWPQTPTQGLPRQGPWRYRQLPPTQPKGENPKISLLHPSCPWGQTKRSRCHLQTPSNQRAYQNATLWWHSLHHRYHHNANTKWVPPSPPHNYSDKREYVCYSHWNLRPPLHDSRGQII